MNQEFLKHFSTVAELKLDAFAGTEPELYARRRDLLRQMEEDPRLWRDGAREKFFDIIHFHAQVIHEERESHVDNIVKNGDANFFVGIYTMLWQQHRFLSTLKNKREIWRIYDDKNLPKFIEAFEKLAILTLANLEDAIREVYREYDSERSSVVVNKTVEQIVKIFQESNPSAKKITWEDEIAETDRQRKRSLFGEFQDAVDNLITTRIEARKMRGEVARIMRRVMKNERSLHYASASREDFVRAVENQGGYFAERQHKDAAVAELWVVLEKIRNARDGWSQHRRDGRQGGGDERPRAPVRS